MKKIHSTDSLQLSIAFDYDTTVTSRDIPEKKHTYSCSLESIKESLAIERDIMFGRGAWLCEQNDKYFAQIAATEKAIDQFMRR